MIENATSGRKNVESSAIPLVLDNLRVEGTLTPTLIIEGRFAGADYPRADTLSTLTAQLTGPRYEGSSRVVADNDRWRATLPLTLARWNGPTLPLPSGSYRVTFLAQGHSHAVDVTRAQPGRTVIDGLFGIEFTVAPDSQHNSTTATNLTVVITPPLTADEIGPANQRRLEAHYRGTHHAPTEAAFFESFYGQNASCNPLGIDRALRERLPAVTRYWSVTDASVEIPPGAVAVIEGSELWWRIRGSARLIVVNDWLRKRYKKQRHQTVLQTWHGTPLKKIALSRPRTGFRATIATLLESSRWDILLAQNPHSARVIQRAYAFTGPIWQEGYPRNDILVTGSAATVRQRLGIADGVTVLLYAPTWRDDRPGHVDHLDVKEFAAKLGEGYITLIRGHSRSLKPGADVFGNRVLDVTSYPDVSDLFLVADALITDYSSVMFDFSVTGKPLFFFAPDLEHYRAKLRGFYFDIARGTPGPVVTTATELIALVLKREEIHARYSQAYANWQERFNPLDDGAAGSRIVTRLIREGIIG